MLTRLTAVTAAALTSLALIVPSATAATPRPASAENLTEALSSTSAIPGTAAESQEISQSEEVTPELAAAALDTAERALEGEATQADPEDTSQAMRNLFLAREALTGARAKRATTLLARPTDGARDPIGMGYNRASVKRCSTNVCLHWVKTGSDRPASAAWVTKNLNILERVFRTTRSMGYPAPAADGRRGGDRKLDVYLKNIGSRGIYGYCAPEKRVGTRPVRSTAYCVLDNDFSRREFKQTPIRSLKATAAHEFFHAVQFNMDVREDSWMMESTATWMEERIFDNVNDNRQYLKMSQLNSPQVPLDSFDDAGHQYASWLFWEFLSARYNPRFVRKVWARAAKPGVNSTTALQRELAARKSSLPQALSDQLAATRYPAKFWPEGKRYARYRASGGTFAPFTLRRTAGAQPRIDHLAGVPYTVRPGTDLPVTARLRVKLSTTGPGLAGTVLIRKRNGTVVRRSVPVARGSGTVTVPFGKGKVTEVVVAVTNGHTKRDNRKISLRFTPLR